MNKIIFFLSFFFFSFDFICYGLCETNIGGLVPCRSHYYVLTNQEDFDLFIDMLNRGNTFAHDTIELSVDVYGENVSNGNRTLSGTFLGFNHKISKMSQPFVSKLTETGTIDSFIFDTSCKVAGTADVAPFCINNYGKIRSCSNYAWIIGSASGESYMHIGGICAISYGSIIDCKNYGKVSATLNGDMKVVVRCGGITSFQQGNNIIACENFGSISASSYYYILCGGINADQQGGSLIGCINHGTVSSTVIGASLNGNASQNEIIHYTGGIVGQAQVGAMIDRCKNYGNVANNTQYVGGIAGQVSDTDLYNLTNYGHVESVQGKFYSCASGITGYIHAVNKVRHIYNCINKGNIISFSQTGIATAAGICADIVNCYIANLYSSGSVSAQMVGGTGTQAFEIQDYEFDTNSIELNKIENTDQANNFIKVDNSSQKCLLYWKQENEGMELCDDFYTYAEPTHGCVVFYVFFDQVETMYNVSVTEKTTGLQYQGLSRSPIRICKLCPSTFYDYEIQRITDNSIDRGTFSTKIPNINVETLSINYDKIVIQQSCDVMGVDDINSHLLINNERYFSTSGAIDTLICVDNLDEDTKYSIDVIYNLNGKEFRSNREEITTKAIIPQISMVSHTPYSLTLKCDNYADIIDFKPFLYVESPKYYKFGGYEMGESRDYKFDNDGFVTIDSLLYGYSPQLFSKYKINGEERRRIISDSFTTLNWGGEGIIQLSPNAAMVHGLFGGMGDYVPERSRDYKYDNASFIYRDATSSDESTDKSIKGICIDNRIDYAATIPLNSFLYQYYIKLWCNRTYYGQYPSIKGNWQIIDSRNPTVDIVEPRFYNIKFENNTIKCSFIEGEEITIEKILEYKIEGVSTFNDIILSKTGGTEVLSKAMNSIVPQLTYLVRILCKTTNGKLYYSPLYRLNNNSMELVSQITTGIEMQKTMSLKTGDSVIINAWTLPVDISDNKIFFESSDPSIVFVDEKGYVTAKKSGSCTITATSVDGGYTAICEVIVTQPVEKLTLETHNLDLKVNDSATLFAELLPSEADDKTFTWSSSNEFIAIVDANGTVTAKKAGEVWIKAVSNDNLEAKDSCKVIVTQPVMGITISPENYRLTNIGENVQLEVVILPDDATNKDVRWTSTNEAVCIVANGKVVATGFGTAVVLATTIDGGFMASCAIVVEKETVPVTEVTISQNSAQLTVGETLQLTATALPSDATNKTLIWKSSDESVCVTTQDGMLIAMNEGSAIITVIPVNGVGQAQCDVTVQAKYDAIDGISNEDNEKPVIYDITGYRVYNLVKGHLYICNGRKFIAK